MHSHLQDFTAETFPKQKPDDSWLVKINSLPHNPDF